MWALAVVIVLVILLAVAVGVGVSAKARSASGKSGFRGRGRGAYRHRGAWWGRPWRGRRPWLGWWPQVDAGWWGGEPYYAPYITDYADVRACPNDPTDGRDLCQGAENGWAVDDRCRAPGLNGDAEYVWRSKPGDAAQTCYSYNP